MHESSEKEWQIFFRMCFFNMRNFPLKNRFLKSREFIYLPLKTHTSILIYYPYNLHIYDYTFFLIFFISPISSHSTNSLYWS